MRTVDLQASIKETQRHDFYLNLFAYSVFTFSAAMIAVMILSLVMGW